MGVTQHTRAPTPRPRSRTCCWSPATTCARAPARIRCAATTTCRAPATTGSMPNMLPGYQSVDDPEVRAALRSGVGRHAADAARVSTTTRWSTPSMQGKLKAMYLIGEEMSIVDSNANYVRGGVRQARVLRRAGHLLQRHLPVRRRRPARRRRAWRRKARSPAPSGGFSGSTRCSSRSTGCRPDWKIIQDVANRLGADWNYQHPSEVMDEIAVADAAVRRRQLRAARGLQVAAVAGRRRRHRSAAALHQAVSPSRTARRGCFPLSWIEPDRAARRGVRSAPEQRPPARALPRGQPDLSRRRASARRRPTRSSKSRPSWPRSAASRAARWVQLISRYGQVRVRALVTDRVQRQATLHADELHRESGEPADQQPHRSGDPHAGVQGNQRAAWRCCREVGESPLPRINSRFGHPTPQQGVEVERKWSRPDYRVPGHAVPAGVKE